MSSYRGNIYRTARAASNAGPSGLQGRTRTVPDSARGGGGGGQKLTEAETGADNGQQYSYDFPELADGYGPGSGRGLDRADQSRRGSDFADEAAESELGQGWSDDWATFLQTLGSMLSPRDTSAQEQQIMDTYQGQLGSGMNALAAQMGAAGFGQSGALQQAGADLQAQLARQAVGDIENVRRGAHQDYMRQLGLVGQMLQGGEQTSMDSEYYGMLTDLIGSMLDEGADSGFTPQVDEDGDGLDDNTGRPVRGPGEGMGLFQQAILGAMMINGAFGGQRGLSFGGYPGLTGFVASEDELPPDADFKETVDLYGVMYDVYVDSNGKEYKVPVVG